MKVLIFILTDSDVRCAQLAYSKWLEFLAQKEILIENPCHQGAIGDTTQKECVNQI